MVATGPSGNYGQSGGQRLLHKGLDAARRVKLLKAAEELVGACLEEEEEGQPGEERPASGGANKELGPA